MLAGGIFLKFAAGTALYYALTQLIQSWLTPRIPRSPDFDTAAAAENHPYNLLRYRLVLSSMFLLVFVFCGVTLVKISSAPGLVVPGVIFGLLFVFMEILYRSVELFGVNRVLIPRYLAENDPAVKTSLRVLIETFSTGVVALYFPLLLGHFSASVLFALALIGDGGLASLTAVALFLNALRLLLRTLAMHAGVRSLNPLNTRIYYPVVISTYTLLSLWLWSVSN